MDISNISPGDVVTETSEEGLFSNLKNSIGGMFVGLLMLVGSVVLLWWNEGNVIREKAALKEMAGAVKEGSVDTPESYPVGTLLHASGSLGSTQLLGDSGFIKPAPYLVLRRNVQMYQWVEHEEKSSSKSIGGSKQTTTTYRYEKEWHDGRVESEHFRYPEGHTNPQLRVSATTLNVSGSTFGRFNGQAVVERLSPQTPLALDSGMLVNPQTIVGDAIQLKVDPAVAEDRIGDLRIRYLVSRPGTYSIIASVAPGNSFSSYTAKNGKSHFLTAAGVDSAASMIETAKSGAKTMAMVLRGAGFLLFWIGLNLLFAPIAALLDIIPFLGSIGRGTFALLSFFIAAAATVLLMVISMSTHGVLNFAGF